MKTAIHEAFEKVFADAGKEVPVLAGGDYASMKWRDQFHWFCLGAQAEPMGGLTDELRKLRHRINGEHGVHVDFKDAMLQLVDAIEKFAALSAAPVQKAEGVQHGMRTVPLEPTPEMLAAGYEVDSRVVGLGGVFKAMIAAAPAPGGDSPA